MSNEPSCQCGQAHGACATEYQYAIKIVCGEMITSQDNVPTPVAPGRYWTAINIHNPNKCQQANFRWKVAIASPGQPGPVTAYSRILPLRPDQALEIDCEQVMKAVPQPQFKFVKGYVVIESDVELDVVAVYSGTPGACGSNSFHTERVQPRCVPVCEDLVLPLHTGFANWQTLSPTVGTVAFTNNSSWAPPPFGSSWVSQSSADGQSASAITRTYEICFDLCFGYTVPGPLRLQALADNLANVFLNGTLVGSVAGFTIPTPLTVNPNLLRAGQNCFRVDVVNVGPSNSPTGFALAGILRVIRGKCPCSPLPIASRSPGSVGLEVETIEPSVND